MTVITIPPTTERIPGPEPAGRVCAHEGCTTILSRWNPSDCCAPCSGGDWQGADRDELHPVEVARLEFLMEEAA